jgi:hypothetical protein
MGDKINYSGSVASMYQFLKYVGVTYRKFLLESGDIIVSRAKFLRTLRFVRVSGDERLLFCDSYFSNVEDSETCTKGSH